VETVNGGIRVETDFASERMQKKIRNAQTRQIPYMLVVGDAEAENRRSGRASSRSWRSGHDEVDDLIERIAKEQSGRADLPKPE
jgi:threonyl-tRNA synthetase